MQKAIPTTIMRGGTSKGLYFDAADLPQDIEARDRLLLRLMGSPDARQIDGMGGAHPLTSKVAVISRSDRDDADVEYLFLQVVVDRAEVRDNQNCGNILAGVGPWAIEKGLVKAENDTTRVRIYMVNTGAIASAEIMTPNGVVAYDGPAQIDGVPGSAAPISLDFLDIAGGSCGALLPTGNAKDVVDGVEVTCIDNGMPVVLMRATDLGIKGTETPDELEANEILRNKIEAIRLKVGPLMNLDDVSGKTVPKMTIISLPRSGGLVHTRSFIPHRVHEAIGVLGAVSVATGCIIKDSVAENIADCTIEAGDHANCFNVEHPTGHFSVDMTYTITSDKTDIHKSALIRTARKLMSGETYAPESDLA